MLIFGGHYTAKDASASQYHHDLYSLEASLWRKVLPEEEIAKEHQVRLQAWALTRKPLSTSQWGTTCGCSPGPRPLIILARRASV